ncbi:hypothetical protein ACVSQB_38645 [Bradyrhizobium elkanii]
MKSLDPETVVYRLEQEARRFRDDFVYGIPGAGRKAEFGVPSLGARAR